MTCPMCEGDVVIHLGTLANRAALRCRSCGWTWTVLADELEQDDD